jgi:hypothetical protein
MPTHIAGIGAKGATMQELTEEGRRVVDEVAARHGMSADAVLTMLRALTIGNGMQAQFSHPELGGMGQWSQGGMTMIGDMFNNGLKYRVDQLAGELAGLLRTQSFLKPVSVHGGASPSGVEGVSLFVPGGGFSAGNWPAELGHAASSGAQNDLHYAYFPDSRRLAIRKGGHITLYDTGDHSIGGVSQQQSGDQSLTFTSQYGLVRVADLPVISGEESPRNVPIAGVTRPEPVAPEASAVPHVSAEPQPLASVQASATPIFSADPQAPVASAPAHPNEDIFAKIERLADLHQKGILTQDEFTQKKIELLARL